MSKPKMYGMKTGYVPNAKADMRHRKKVYQRGRENLHECQGAAEGEGGSQWHSVKFI